MLRDFHYVIIKNMFKLYKAYFGDKSEKALIVKHNNYYHIIVSEFSEDLLYFLIMPHEKDLKKRKNNLEVNSKCH